MTLEGFSSPKTSIGMNSVTNYFNGTYNIKLKKLGEKYNIPKFPGITGIFFFI
jgi:hypothetical protein